MGRHKKDKEQTLIRWRRKRVAEMWFSGDDVKTISSVLQVAPSTVYADQEYIENHADELMKNYIVKTVPHIINRSLYQIDMANKMVLKIMRDENAERKERISAALAAAKTARDMVEIVAGNKGVVDKALELDESLNREEASLDELLLSGDSAETEESTEDPDRVF